MSDERLDDELRRRARAARAEVEAQVDVDSELTARPPTSNVAPVVPPAPRRRLVAVAGSIAAVAVGIVGGVVLLRGPDSIETVEPAVDVTTNTSSATPPITLCGPPADVRRDGTDPAPPRRIAASPTIGGWRGPGRRRPRASP